MFLEFYWFHSFGPGSNFECPCDMHLAEWLLSCMRLEVRGLLLDDDGWGTVELEDLRVGV